MGVECKSSMYILSVLEMEKKYGEKKNSYIHTHIFAFILYTQIS